MSKLGLVGWAVAAVLAALIVAGVTRAEDAAEEREARIAAEGRARAANDSLAKLWTAWRADSIADAHADSIADARIAEAQERARLAEASAVERTERLRETLNAEQQAELDDITAYWQEAVREAEAVSDTLRSMLARAEAQAADNLALALSERERGDRWHAAYEAAQVEIDALRKPDWLSLELDDVPKITAALALGYLAGR